MLCGTINILQIIPTFNLNVCIMLSVPQNIVMDMNNVMKLQRKKPLYWKGRMNDPIFI